MIRRDPHIICASICHQSLSQSNFNTQHCGLRKTCNLKGPGTKAESSMNLSSCQRIIPYTTGVTPTQSKSHHSFCANPNHVLRQHSKKFLSSKVNDRRMLTFVEQGSQQLQTWECRVDKQSRKRQQKWASRLSLT